MIANPLTLSPACAATLAKYYERVKHGDFLGVMNCLNPEVVYRIPGDPTLLPFAGDWVGHEAVGRLFRNFGNAFWITRLSQIQTITAAAEAIEFNDEAFKVKSTGRYYRVAVVHHLSFDEQGLIKSLVNTHDTYVARLAFQGNAPIVEPIPSSETATCALSAQQAEQAITTFFNSAPQDSARLCDEQSVLEIPGNPTLLPFAGCWLGGEQIRDGLQQLRKTIGPLRLNRIVVNDANAAAIGEFTCSPAYTGRWIALIRFSAINLLRLVTIVLDTDPVVGRQVAT